MNKFKMVFIPSIDSSISDNTNHNEYVSYHKTLDEALLVLNTVSEYTLMLHDNSLMPDYSNVGMLFHNIDGEWVDIDEEGMAIW